MEIIVCHVNADFDCLSSMLGAKKLYPSACAVFPGSQERKVKEFLEIFTPFPVTRLKDLKDKRIDRMIIVDTKSASRLGPLEDIARSPEVKLHIYDHHPFNEDDLRGQLEVVEDVGATATIFTEIIKERKIPITPMEATVLCLGIYEETGSLRFPSTTVRDLLAVAYLLKKGANLNIVSEYIKTEFGRDELEILKELMESAHDITLYGIRIRIVKAVRRDYVGDIAPLAHRIMDMEDIDGLILLMSMEGKIIVVGRSRVPEFDVSKVLEPLGGGGHPVAASATLKEEPLEIVQERIEEIIRTVVKPQKVARDIMTSPVITIQHNKSIRDAEILMTRYGVNVLPVLKKDRYMGILSREVVEKALLHGFRESPVSDFTTTDAETTSPETPVSEVERTMIEQNQRFMPVVEKDRVIGAITRTDLLRTLYEETLRRRRITEEEPQSRASIGRNIRRLLEERFPAEVTRLLRDAGEVGDSLGYPVYLVGGSVRDILRGERNLDIDIVVEGDGIELAQRLARRYDSVRVITHRRFNTAKLIFKKDMPHPDFTVDVATARTEYYEKPASLPKVETSSIKKDLYRRDFTINTLAVKLNRKDFGLLLDYFGAQRDIKEGIIRVLHNLSFIEDPTRAFRAVRFAERFGFRISKHTENLIKSALRLNLFESISGTRIYDELVLTFNETDPVAALKRLADYGLLSVIHRALKFDRKLEETLKAVHESLTWFDLLFLDEEIDRPMIYLMGLLTPLDLKQTKEALERLATPPKKEKEIIEGKRLAHEVINRLMTDDPVVIYNTLKPLNLETILYTMAISGRKKIQKAVSRYLLELRKVKPSLRGDDLKRMGIPPGPVYSEILEVLTRELLAGRIKTREDEVKYVLSHYAGKDE